jgi:hypothetical protein
MTVTQVCRRPSVKTMLSVTAAVFVWSNIQVAVEVWEAFHQMPSSPVNVLWPCAWVASNHGSRTFWFCLKIFGKRRRHIEVVFVNRKGLGAGIWMEPKR